MDAAVAGSWLAAAVAVPADIDLRLRAGGAVFEVDCGTGLNCLALAQAYPTAVIHGQDVDRLAVRRAQALAKTAGVNQRVSFAVGDSTRLPRAAFDLVAAFGVFAFAKDARLLNAIRNALVPTGACVLAEPMRVATRNRRLHREAAAAGFSQLRILRQASLVLYELRR
jgi:cyclopropane fatty-acyl-phospholipid synthase-like methyltransferase